MLMSGWEKRGKMEASKEGANGVCFDFAVEEEETGEGGRSSAETP